MVPPSAWPFLALVLATPPASPPAPTGLGLSLPAEILEVADIAGWEHWEGHAAIDGRDVAYVHYVDPRYPALYRLTRYRVTLVTRTADGRQVRTAEEEKLVWNSRPGSGEALRCYSLAVSPEEWRAVPQGSDIYRTALSTVISLYRDTQRLLEDAVPPDQRQ